MKRVLELNNQPATHYIEVVDATEAARNILGRQKSDYMTYGPDKIENLSNNLEESNEMYFQCTLAVFKIRWKNAK